MLLAVLRVQVMCVKCWAVESVRVQISGGAHGRSSSMDTMRALLIMRGARVMQRVCAIRAPMLLMVPCSSVKNKVRVVVIGGFWFCNTLEMSLMVSVYPDPCGARIP